MSEPTSHRLIALDALRGLAALAVVLFHFTTRFEQLYAPATRPWLSFPLGHYGVNMFFIISGFVIFMTLERTTKPMDFVVSRFSRLFPAYWVAIALTFLITHTLGLPGKLVGVGTAFANGVMLHGLFGVPHVDGVYWTLEVELLFYMGMLLPYMAGQLHRIHLVLLLVLAVRWVYFISARVWGIDLPWTIYRLLILEHLPWFALGIAIYTATRATPRQRRAWPIATALASLLTLGATDAWAKALLALALAGLVVLAASGRAPLLTWRPLVWLGTISYPLYLLHENIGWSVMLQLVGASIPIEAAIGLSLVAVMMLADCVSRTVERPAMRAIRARYRSLGDARTHATRE
jgi:peptidoglycan/LPS O-acetylase OafA/YrhL